MTGKTDMCFLGPPFGLYVCGWSPLSSSHTPSYRGPFYIESIIKYAEKRQTQTDIKREENMHERHRTDSSCKRSKGLGKKPEKFSQSQSEDKRASGYGKMVQFVIFSCKYTQNFLEYQVI